ncbi:hypothetical protein E2320_020514 [Naja naja]|nr:hypothetical protein E2320_020514 [Naja naja]
MWSQIHERVIAAAAAAAAGDGCKLQHAKKKGVLVSLCQRQLLLGLMGIEVQTFQRLSDFQAVRLMRCSFMYPCMKKCGQNVNSEREIKEFQPCLFEESMVAISESGETIGTFSISVKSACYSLDGWQEEDCFLFRDHPVETKIQVVKRHGQLYVAKTIVEKDEEINVSTFSYRCAQLEGLISESANFLVLRVMARRQSLPQDAIFLSFDSDQHICTSTYPSSAIGYCLILYLSTTNTESPINLLLFLFPPSRHLSCRVQVGSPATMVILQMPILIDIDEPDPRPVFEKVLLDWEEDEELQASHATYVRRHPELNTLLADFLQLLLLRKPDDVVTFAAEFFAPFSAQQPPCRSFRSSDRPSPFRSHV